MISEKLESQSLDNNLKLNITSIPGGKTALFSVAFHAGAMYETGFGSGSNDGISHFIEHMFFKGPTPCNRTTKQINEEFSRLGADLNAYTTYDHTIFFAKVPTRNLRKAAEIWKDLLIKKEIDSTEFDAEKQVVLQEIQLYDDMPEFKAGFTARKEHFSGTPLEHNILGTLESVGAIEVDMMKDYIDQFYTFDNALVSLVGGGFNLRSETKFLASIFNDPIYKPRTLPTYPPKVSISSKRSNLSYHESSTTKPLSYVAICWDTPGIRSKHFFPLLLLNTYFGNSRTSLLYREIISKGIAPSCRYGFEAFNDVCAITILYLSPPTKTDGVFNRIIELLIQVRDLKISLELTTALKEEIWGSYLSEIEDPSNYGIDLAQKYIKFREPLPARNFHDKIYEITPEEIQSIKDEIFEEMNMTVYATGTVPQDWKPSFPDKGPW
ncbi:MAG: M16 family metallopeptidase [Candidatus Hodarchaeota archaeon]